MTNYSVFAIPAYLAITIIPHGYGQTIIKNANNQHWDSANPRSTAWNDTVKKAVPASTFARYERAKAAHANGMENFPLLIGAIILGNVAKLPSSTLNTVAAAFLAMRLAYTYAYINTETIPGSFVRTGIWFASTASLMYLVVMAGSVLA